MKKILLLSIVFVCIMSQNIFSQCNIDVLLGKCYLSLDNYKFLKSFPVKMKKVEKGEPSVFKQPVILNSDLKYKIVICNSSDNKGELILSLLKGNTMIATTYNSDTKKYYSSIEFTCRQSGVYYLSYNYVDGKSGCSVIILSQEKDESEK